MRFRCLTVATLAVAAGLTALTHPALADNGNGRGDNVGWTDGSGVGASATSPGSTGTSSVASGSGNGSAPVCTYEPLSAQETATATDMAAQGWGPTPGNGPGTWYRKICVESNGLTSGVIVWAPQAQAVNTSALAQEGLGYTPLGSPNIRLNPSANQDQLVNVTTWLWLNGASWTPVSATASAGGVTVTTTAVPQKVVWTMGDGGSVTCAGPGTPYDPSRPDAQPSCSYTYRRSSAGQPDGTFTITATESWLVSWTATGVPAGMPAGGSLGIVTHSSQVAVRVAESQAINTGG